MRLRVSDPSLIPDLVEFLRSRLDVVAVPVSPHEVDVSLLGSYGDAAMRLELELRVRAWETGRTATVEVVVDGDVGGAAKPPLPGPRSVS